MSPTALSSSAASEAVALALTLAIHFEGIYLSAYLDVVGIPTIGIGCTQYPTGARVLLTDPPITREQALEMCRWSLERRYLRAVLTLCPLIDLSDRIAALADFAFNLGVGRLKASTLRRYVNAGRWSEVPAEILKWNRAGGRSLAGLTARRAVEAALIVGN